MTPNQFWYDEPRLLDVYIKKRELELDVINYNSWLIGLYVEDAMGVVMANSFGKNSNVKYFEQPLECFNYNKKPEKKKIDYREQTNMWAKFGKKK